MTSMTSMNTGRSELYGLIAGLAGRIPDDGLAVLRGCVALDDTASVFAMLLDVVDNRRLVLTAEENALLWRLCRQYGADPSPLDSAPTAPVEPLPYTFAAPDMDDEWSDAVDEIAILTATGVEVTGLDEYGAPEFSRPELPLAARAMWRVARSSPRVTVDVRLVEIAADADPVAMTMRIQQEIAEFGEAPPRVEVFTEGGELTPYQQDALAGAILIWAAEEPVEPRLAAVFDGAHPDTGPFFRPDHPVLPEAERAELLRALRGGEQILGSFGLLDDIVTGAPSQVPVGYCSDGVWIWSDASLYYLERHGLVPDAELCAHLREHPDAPAQLTHLQRQLVLETLMAPDPDEEDAAR